MIDNTKNTQISVFDIKIKRIFVANNVLLNNTIMKKLLLLAFVLCSSLLCRAQEERVILCLRSIGFAVDWSDDSGMDE